MFTSTEQHLSMRFDLFEYAEDTNHEQSIKWLIEVSMKEDERIDKVAVLER